MTVFEPAAAYSLNEGPSEAELTSWFVEGTKDANMIAVIIDPYTINKSKMVRVRGRIDGCASIKLVRAMYVIEYGNAWMQSSYRVVVPLPERLKDLGRAGEVAECDTPVV
jgi:hypothetical protein